MMHKKRIPFFLLALILCMALVACGSKPTDNDEDDDVIVGDDWRVSGVVQGYGTITRNGEDTDVLVTLSQKDAAIYYDTEEQMLFDSVEFPITLAADPAAIFQGVSFADRNDDDNSDVALLFNDGENSMLMVWFWDAESESYVYQPDESQTDVLG